jgi:lipopolysaccharide/colanic/teichoic acid biosynthesis glycosyltransferase
MGGAMGPALRLTVEPDVARRPISLQDVTRRVAAESEFRADEHDDVDAGETAREVSLERARGVYATFVKPALDRVIAAALAVLVLPLCVLIAAAIRLKMGKGVIFKQVRVGKDGRPFEVWKFRTMHHDRRRSQQPIDIADRRRTHKSENDPRHTPIGRFLRQSSLDELPQLVNVMRGEMSLIGPRPELVQLVQDYPEWQHARHAVRPGMTGLWQVSARGEKSMQECVDIDLDYVEHVSPWLDLRTALATPIAALGKRRGA